HSGVRVEARDRISGQVLDVATTDPDGRYSFWVPPGSYLIVAMRDGFSTAQLSVEVRAGLSLSDINFTLRRLQ
ncbi:MAG: carboxypeptidase-like regulatory domain-containing protein, partial [Armatimonadetes bacterium]|nr:carboxypeptidase-like regulatory domain-containing protein [Armatimonadota bacterium]